MTAECHPLTGTTGTSTTEAMKTDSTDLIHGQEIATEETTTGPTPEDLTTTETVTATTGLTPEEGIRDAL